MKPLKEAVREAQENLCSQYGLKIELQVIVRNLPESEMIKMVNAIFNAIEKETSITKAELISESRKQRLCDVRYIAMYLLRFKAMLKLEQVAFYLQRDHTTMLHGINRYFELMQIDLDFRQTVERIVKHLPEIDNKQKEKNYRTRFTKAA